MVENIRRFQVWLVDLNPTRGSEINKRRPWVIISPNELHSLSTVIVAPMTTKGFQIDSRVELNFQNKKGLIILDQIRTIDKNRLVKNLGEISINTQTKVCDCLQEMFSY